MNFCLPQVALGCSSRCQRSCYVACPMIDLSVHVLKGIVTAEDALLAVEHGVDAIIISNHGGRQLDTSISTIEALPEIAEAVAGRIPILLDGGVRRGTDV